MLCTQDTYRTLPLESSNDGATRVCSAHPSSVVAEMSNPPTCVVYHELVKTSKCFMRHVVAVEQKWVKTMRRRIEMECNSAAVSERSAAGGSDCDRDSRGLSIDVLRLTGHARGGGGEGGGGRGGAASSSSTSKKRAREGEEGEGGSGPAAAAATAAAGAAGTGEARAAAEAAVVETVESKVDAAKRRFLERKRARAAQ